MLLDGTLGESAESVLASAGLYSSPSPSNRSSWSLDLD